MAKLSIDVEIKGVRNAKGQLEDLVVVGEEAEQVFERISGASGFSALAGQIKAVNKLAFSITEKYKQLNDHIDELKTNRGHASLLRETKKQIEATKELDGEYKQYIQRLNRGARRSSDTLDSVQEEVRSLRTANKLLKAQEGIAKKVHDARVKGMRNYYRNQAKLEKKHARDVARNEARKKKQFRDTHAFQQRMARQRAQEEAANARKAYQRRKKYLQRLGAISAGLGFGFAAGGAAGVAVGAINLVTRAVEGLARAWVGMQRRAAESFYTINDQMQQLRILLDTATGSTQGGAGAMAEILQFSTEAPFSIDSLTGAYVKLRTSGLDPMDGTLQTLTDSVAAFGGKSYNFDLVTEAIRQMVGKGVISMEELRRQMGEQIPTAIRAMARGLGVSVLELYDLVESGTLDTHRALNALIPELEKLHGGAALKRMESMSGAMTKLRNSWIRLMMDVGQNNGLWATLTGVVNDAADAINEFRESAEGQQVIGELTRGLKDAINVLRENKGLVSDFFTGMSDSLRTSAKWIATIVKSLLDFQKWFQDTGWIEKWFDVWFKFGVKGTAERATGVVTYLLKALGLDGMSDRVGNFFLDAFNYAEDGYTWLKDKIKGITGDPDWMNITSDWDLGLDSMDFSTPLEQLEAMDAKQFTNLESELTELEQTMFKTKDALKELSEEFDKILDSNYKEERKFELTFGLGSGEDTRAIIADLGQQIAAVNVSDAEGKEQVLELLKKQRDLIREMETDVNKVTKAEVAAAKQKYEAYYKISRGGKTAGTRKELQELRSEYERLAKLQKAGKADSEKEKELAKEKLGLLRENTNLTEQAKEAASADLNSKLKELEGEYETKQKMFEAGVKNIDELRKLESSAHAVKMQELNEQWKMYQKINQERLLGVAPSASADYSPTSYPGRYAGGPVSSNQPYIVGERGPELFVPENNGQIIPNNELSASNTTEVVLNFNGNKVGPMFSTKQVAKEVLREFEIMQGALS